MPNDDRVSERYYGQINSLESHQATRQRIHWICRQTAGERILDVGCSQGITSILLAREGFEVTGVDLDEASLAFAKEELMKESPPVRRKVSFLLANLLEWETNLRFHTVILGEVLEHFSHPAQLLLKAHSLLREDGRIIITVPYGFHPFHDHKQTFYAGNLLLLLEPYYSELHMEIHHKYLYCTGQRKKRSGQSLPAVRAQLMERCLMLDARHFAEIEWQHYKTVSERKKAASAKVGSEYGGGTDL
jgi:cyclopropane fatty-acyl-phospholipid synthase-like methyltransferase